MNKPAVLDNRIADESVSKEAVRRMEAWLELERNRRKLIDTDGRIDTVQEFGSARFQYAYNGRGDLTQITEADGSVKGYKYDDNRRLILATHADGSTASYTYGENDRLAQTEHRGIVHTFEHDEQGRLKAARRGNAGASVYRYDSQGRVVEARTSLVSTRHRFDAEGRVTGIGQSINGITLNVELAYDSAGRLAEMKLLDSKRPVRYTWDAKGRPQGVALGDRQLASFQYADDEKLTRVELDNGIVEESHADMVDSRPVERTVSKDGCVLFQRSYAYNADGQIVSDGTRQYEYDELGRLSQAENLDTDSLFCNDALSYGLIAPCTIWRYAYDAMDNLVQAEKYSETYRYAYDGKGQLQGFSDSQGRTGNVSSDAIGRIVSKPDESGQWTYRYNDAGQLTQALRKGDSAARFTYDHKDRLVLAQYSDRTERYLYGPDDELLAVTDENGNSQRLYIRTPLGILAEVHGSLDSGEVYFLHNDERGTCHCISNNDGKVVARFAYSPYGTPIYKGDFSPIFSGRVWSSEVGLYSFSARWYSPELARFMTPDSYTGAPDDERIVNPIWAASNQPQMRAELLGSWLKRPRCRNPYDYCGNDPLNRADPNGHWSFGGVLLMILGAIWTLPNTIFGLLVEITCLIGEVIRWLVWLFSGGNVSWATPGFDAAASGRLNAFALVFKGGWLGSFSSLLGITFGNVFFVYEDWENDPYYQSMPDPVYPSAYNGSVSVPKNEVLYEHELRHTNQYGWFGPFFHLGLPIFGVYEWDVIFNGYSNAWLERDARAHGGL